MPGLRIEPGDGSSFVLGNQTNRARAIWRIASPATGGRAWWMSIDPQGGMVLDRGSGSVGVVPWGTP